MSDTSRHAPLAMDPATFRALGHQLVDQVAGLLEGIPLVQSLATSRHPQSASALGLNGPLPEKGTDQVRCSRKLRSCSSSTHCSTGTHVLRLHHGVAGADRHARRFSGRGGQSQRWSMDTGAGRHRNRDADRALDRGADRLPVDGRRTALERRQHGQHDLLHRGACGARWLGRARARDRRRRRAPVARLRLHRDAHVDPESRGPGWPGHRVDPLDSCRCRTAHGRAGTAAAARGRYRQRRRAVRGGRARRAR